MMTPEDINDAVARKLGWRDFINHNKKAIPPISLSSSGFCEQYLDIPDYCHSIEAVWEVAEKFNVIDEWWCFTVHAYLGGWQAGWSDRDGKWLHATTATTAPMAICLAFLKLP